MGTITITITIMTTATRIIIDRPSTRPCGAYRRVDGAWAAG